MMILDDFIVLNSAGYYCSYADFYIDPKVPVNTSLVSHAHADHASPGSNDVYCTAPTADFMKLRYKHKSAKEFHLLEFNQTVNINGVNVTFIPAGHMLGSAQILMEYKGVRYLYSGDIKLQEDASCEPVLFVESDVLITETTFANEQYIHPDPLEEIKKLDHAVTPVVVGTYVLGKAQRLTSLIHQVFPEKKVFIHFDISAYHKVYDKYGMLPGNYEIMQKKNIRRGDAGIYLMPPLSFQSYKIRYPYIFAFASGWEQLQEKGLSLKISDHLDWGQLMNYISEVKPKEIWCIHGDSSHLIKHFSEGSIIVKPIHHVGGI